MTLPTTTTAEGKNGDDNIAKKNVDEKTISSGKRSAVEKASSVTVRTASTGERTEFQFSAPIAKEGKQVGGGANRIGLEKEERNATLKKEVENRSEHVNSDRQQQQSVVESFEMDGISIPGNSTNKSGNKIEEGKMSVERAADAPAPADGIAENVDTERSNSNMAEGKDIFRSLGTLTPAPGGNNGSQFAGQETEKKENENSVCVSDQDCPKDAFCSFGFCVMPNKLRHKPPRLCFKVN